MYCRSCGEHVIDFCRACPKCKSDPSYEGWFCKECGKELENMEQEYCKNCGCLIEIQKGEFIEHENSCAGTLFFLDKADRWLLKNENGEKRDIKIGRKRSAALVLAIFLGLIGIHRFYMGRYISGWALVFLFILGKFVFSETMLPVIMVLVWFSEILFILTNWLRPVKYDFER